MKVPCPVDGCGGQIEIEIEAGSPGTWYEPPEPDTFWPYRHELELPGGALEVSEVHPHLEAAVSEEKYADKVWESIQAEDEARAEQAAELSY